MVGAKPKDYLKVIYHLQSDNHSPVAPSDIASGINVTTPTVTSTMNKLYDNGLVEREKYKGVGLSEAGEAIALDALRHHRLLELYLLGHLDYDWTEVNEEADSLEHHISKQFGKKIAAMLGDPATDPHRAPIPNEDLELPADGERVPLDSCNEGDIVIIKQVSARVSDELEYLGEAGITLGARFNITETAPFGLVTLGLKEVGKAVSLPEEITALLQVSIDEQLTDATNTANGVV